MDITNGCNGTYKHIVITPMVMGGKFELEHISGYSELDGWIIFLATWNVRVNKNCGIVQ